MSTFNLKTTFQQNLEVSPEYNKLNRLIERIEQQKELLAIWQDAKSEIQHYARQKLMPAYNQLNLVLFQQLECLWNSLGEYDFSPSDLLQLDKKIQDLTLLLQSNQTMTEKQLHLIKQIMLFYQQKAEQVELKRSKQLKQNKQIQTKKDFHDDKVQKSNDIENTDLDREMDKSESWDWERELDQQRNQYSQAREQAKLKRKQDKTGSS